MDNKSLSHFHIGFVGAGSMAEALIQGLVNKEIVPPGRIIAMNRSNRERLAELAGTYGIRTAVLPTEKEEAIRQCDILVLAFKPKDAVEGLRELKPLLTGRHILVSVIAGLSIAAIQRIVGPVPVVRAMPNTSSSIGLGATGICHSKEAQQRGDAVSAVYELFGASGICCPVSESQLDIVTGVSGSGPAYVYYLIESMIRAGIVGGLDEAEARRLTVQTVLGAARMVELTGEDPAVLRHKVTSPNGTTQAALEMLDRHGFSEAVQQAVHRAAERSRELGAQIDASVIDQT